MVGSHILRVQFNDWYPSRGDSVVSSARFGLEVSIDEIEEADTMLARVSSRSPEHMQDSRVTASHSSLLKHLAKHSIFWVFTIINKSAREGPHSRPNRWVWAAFNHQ